MIYYISLDNPNPSGGVKTQYRHVEILNRNGFNAAMLHQTPGFTAATWFASTAPIQYAGHTEIGVGDVLVWPEILRTSIRPMVGVKQIIFNQNVHYTWRGTLPPGLPLIKEKYDYTRFVDGTIVLTDYEHRFLHTMYPTHPIGIVRHGIDPSIWAYDGREKSKTICYMPRKHHDEAEAVFGWLASSGVLAGWNVESIDQLSERDTSERFKDAGVFFAFGYPEGGTLPPFEALSAGCAVIGYGGFASDNLLSEAGGRKIPSGDSCQFAAVASLLLPGLDISKDAATTRSQHVLRMFGLEQEEESLIKFMKEIMNG